jgi:hypothetical protein
LKVKTDHAKSVGYCEGVVEALARGQKDALKIIKTIGQDEIPEVI